MKLYYYKWRQQQGEQEMMYVKKFPKSERLLKEALTHYNETQRLDLTEEQILALHVKRDKYGKPYFASDDVPLSKRLSSIQFSISHSGKWWACIFDDRVVGLDIEDLDRFSEMAEGADLEESKKKVKYEALAKRFFTPQEYDYVKEMGEKGFFDIWIRKESYIKWKGTGLAEGLNTFTVLEGKKPSQRVIGIGEELYFSQIDLGKNVKAICCSTKAYNITKGIEVVEI